MTQKNTFNNIDGWKREFQDCLGSRDNKKSIPYILIGNKIDQVNNRKISEEAAREWCRKNGDIPYFETSAKDGTSVREAFISAGTLAFKNRQEV